MSRASEQSAQPADPRPRVDLLADDEHSGFLLVKDNVRQSFVDPDDPEYLDFEYMQFFASVVEGVEAGPLAVTHLGGGALTFPRYLSVVRPSSPQIVCEPDVELTELVRTRLPLPRNHRIRVRPQDALTGIAALREASADLVVLDAYAGGQVPAELTTEEFFADCSRVLRSEGMLLANLVDDPGLQYIGRAYAGLDAVFGQVVLICSTDVWKGRRFGNVVLAAAARLPDLGDLARRIARQPFPATVRTPEELAIRFGTSKPFTAADSSASPEPASREGWRLT